MKIVESIKTWPVEKKVFVAIMSAAIISGATYGFIKINNYLYLKSLKNKNKK